MEFKIYLTLIVLGNRPSGCYSEAASVKSKFLNSTMNTVIFKTKLIAMHLTPDCIKIPKL